MPNDGMKTDDPAFRFTYKVTHTYCVQSTGPILESQTTTCLVERYETGVEDLISEAILEEAGCHSKVFLANIHAEATDNADWSLF